MVALCACPHYWLPSASWWDVAGFWPGSLRSASVYVRSSTCSSGILTREPVPHWCTDGFDLGICNRSRYMREICVSEIDLNFLNFWQCLRFSEITLLQTLSEIRLKSRQLGSLARYWSDFDWKCRPMWWPAVHTITAKISDLTCNLLSQRRPSCWFVKQRSFFRICTYIFRGCREQSSCMKEDCWGRLLW